VAQEPLDRPDINARFEEVGRKTMAERMDAMAVRHPRTWLHMIGDCLGRAEGHRDVGIKARQQPRAGPVALPVGAQLGQQTGRESSGAILPPFALFDAPQQAITCAIRAPQPDDFADAQARGIRGHQEDAVPRIPRRRQQALAFLDAQDVGEW